MARKRAAPPADEQKAAPEPDPIAAVAAKQTETHDLLQRIATAKKRQTCCGYLWMALQFGLLCAAIAVGLYLSLAMTTLIGTLNISQREMAGVALKTVEMGRQHEDAVRYMHSYIKDASRNSKEQRALVYSLALRSIENTLQKASYLPPEHQTMLYRQISTDITRAYDLVEADYSSRASAE